MSSPLDSANTRSLPTGALSTLAVYVIVEPSATVVPSAVELSVTVLVVEASATLVNTVPVFATSSKLPPLVELIATGSSASVPCTYGSFARTV